MFLARKLMRIMKHMTIARNGFGVFEKFLHLNSDTNLFIQYMLENFHNLSSKNDRLYVANNRVKRMKVYML